MLYSLVLIKSHMGQHDPCASHALDISVEKWIGISNIALKFHSVLKCWVIFENSVVPESCALLTIECKIIRTFSLCRDQASRILDVTGENMVIAHGCMSNASNVIMVRLKNNLLITVDRLDDLMTTAWFENIAKF